MEETKRNKSSGGQNQDPDVPTLTPAKDEDVPPKSGHTGTVVVKAPKFYIGKKPVKFDFHFPDEVWEIILNMLTEDEDRTNCCRAFPLFDKLLTKSKPVWLFKQILPSLMFEVPSSDLLTCRRICKQWHDDIEARVVADGVPCHFGQNMYAFSSLEKVTRFIKKFEGHAISGRNPFIHRFLAVENCREADFENKMVDIMSNFGRHIWSLQVHWNYEPVPVHEHPFFQQIITRTPNLKELACCGFNHRIFRDIVENPLPAIPTLESLDMSTLVTAISADNVVLPYASQLKSLRVNTTILGKLMPQELPQLEFVKLHQLSNDDELERLLHLTAPLTKLEINGKLVLGAENSGDDPSIDVSTFVRVFEAFPLIREVTVNYCSVTMPMDLSHLSNSTVRYFKFYYWNDKKLPTSFDFLRVFKALEELQVNLWSPKETYFGRDEGVGKVQLYKMLEGDQLYESNIWSLVPSLKEVRIECGMGAQSGGVVGNRKEFEVYQARRLLRI